MRVFFILGVLVVSILGAAGSGLALVGSIAIATQAVQESSRTVGELVAKAGTDGIGSGDADAAAGTVTFNMAGAARAILAHQHQVAHEAVDIAYYCPASQPSFLGSVAEIQGCALRFANSVIAV